MDKQLVKKKATKRPRSKQNLRLWLKLLSCTNLIERDIQTHLRDTDVTLPRFDFLAVLYRAGSELNMGSISRQLMVSNGNVTGIADRLEKQGLIRRWPWPNDRRHWYAALTEEGQRVFQELAQEHEQWVAEALQGLDDHEVEQLMGLLTKLKQSVEISHKRGNGHANA